MSKINYVVNETFEQARRRQRFLQREKTRMLRLMNDPQVQDVAAHFIKLKRLPEEKETYNYLRIFGESYRDYEYRSLKICVKLVQAYVAVFLVGNFCSNDYVKEFLLVLAALFYFGLLYRFVLGVNVALRMFRNERAICCLVEENLRNSSSGYY